jgi:type IV pilus assembly protein PilE
MKSQSGFTLIELLVVVAIIGIIASIALPNYQRQMSESRREDAHVGLLRMADLQEKFYLQNNRYGTAAEVTNTTENGWYTLRVTASSVSGFTLTATPSAGSPQLNDVAACQAITLNQAGQKLPATPVNCW